MRRSTALVAVSAIVTAIAPLLSQGVAWVDPSPHKATSIEVEADVRLEVLDWGGSGRPLILLTGLGDAAHVFDDAGPELARRNRVVAITRRGHPGSSAPATGYATARLAEDVVRVIDTLGLNAPIVVGHSLAGEEMHVLGARYANRISGLVYVDAAFNRGDVFEEYESLLKAVAPPPRPGPADLASFGSLRAFLTTTGAPPGPEGRLRARYVGNPDGSVRGPWTPPPHVLQAFGGELQAMTKNYNPEPIRVPALAIYAVPISADALMRPWYNRQDPDVIERVEQLYRLERENVGRHAGWFRRFAERGRVAEVSGGHDLFVSNPRAVLDQIESFAPTLSVGLAR